MPITKEQWDAIQARWLTEVFANAGTIDPGGEHDWTTLALGFLLANGVPFEQCRYAILCEMSHGNDYVPMNLGEEDEDSVAMLHGATCEDCGGPLPAPIAGGAIRVGCPRGCWGD